MSELSHLFETVNACLDGCRLDEYADFGKMFIYGKLDLRKLLALLKSGEIDCLGVGENDEDGSSPIHDCVYCENERLRTQNSRLKARIAKSKANKFAG